MPCAAQAPEADTIDHCRAKSGLRLREYCHVLHATAALVAAAEIEGEAEGDKLVVGAGVVAEVASDDGLGAGASGTCSCVTVQPLLRLVRTKAA